MSFLSSRQAAMLLGVNPSRLIRAIWDNRLDPPTKGPGGAFLWTDADLERASWLLRGRSADDLLQAGKGGSDGR